MGPTLDTGGSLALTRRGLTPRKRRQALLGATTHSEKTRAADQWRLVTRAAAVTALGDHHEARRVRCADQRPRRSHCGRDYDRGRQSVSILVLLDWEWRQAGSDPGHEFRKCFNPCSVGLGMAAAERPDDPQNGPRFQSLFCWIGNGGAEHTEARTQKSDVSILVLLDWEWRPPLRPPVVTCICCFNPCSVGLGMAALWHQLELEGLETVSILVLLDWEWRQDRQGATSRSRSRFQSLFCWIGNGGVLEDGTRGYIQKVSILVLLDWEWRPASFNSTGPASPTFQSLFCWIGNGGLRFGHQWHVGYVVSILVLLDWEWRPRSRVLNFSLACFFNPCSVGLGMAAALRGDGAARGNRVSILVLLDWEWRPHGRLWCCGGESCFNPCSVGLGMAAASRSGSVARQTRFNPCSVGLGMAAIRAPVAC